MAHSDSDAGSTQFPAELLHIVASHVAVDYLDDVIAGSLSLPSQDFETVQNDMYRLLQAAPQIANNDGDDVAENANLSVTGVAEADTFDFYSDKALERDNPIIALLQTGAQLRATILDVLSGLLGIHLIKEGIGRLAEKPWRSIQLARYAWANPAYICYFKQNPDLSALISSPSSMIVTYMTISESRFKWQAMRNSLASVTGRVISATFQHLMCFVIHLLKSSLNMPKSIRNEIARTKIARKRVRGLTEEISEFLIFEIFTVVWRYLIGFICNAEEMIPGIEALVGEVEGTRPMLLDELHEKLPIAYTKLSEFLSSSVEFANAIKPLLHIREDTNLTEINLARESLQMIIQYEGRSADYASCQKSAQELHDWLDSIYDCQTPAEGTTT
ncbi:hypothetical protein BDY19DRAFT_997988 [Irpex rosettiformis]|uniref:Uncharacterized protein n=1 Tax=Irpex rosettiformis TaxID=378272 RepID=A0ACB8TQ95_9APHY|nr:hypothetical protein BDY19DRAFT_997988 [Irpex rosettiformis]